MRLLEQKKRNDKKKALQKKKDREAADPTYQERPNSTPQVSEQLQEKLLAALTKKDAQKAKPQEKCKTEA